MVSAQSQGPVAWVVDFDPVTTLPLVVELAHPIGGQELVQAQATAGQSDSKPGDGLNGCPSTT